jgi:nitrous oxide reductase accessory protein NosL
VREKNLNFGKKAMKRFITALLISLIISSLAVSAEKTPLKPSEKDKCPVCGMFVYKYPDWTAQIIFTDGSVFFFDGAKDLFKFYFDIKKYSPEKSQKDIAAIYLTEYYEMKLIKDEDAFFVIGGDVYGPMGKELIPFVSRADAEAFKKDHKGRRILRFENIKPVIIKKLD